jgi:anti-sigma factor RsiW
MRCDRATPLLNRLIDRELGFLARQLLLRHIGRCAGCAGRLAALQSVRTALRERLSYHRAPPALAARIGAAIAREEPLPLPAPPRLRGARVRLAGASLAGALAGIALTLVLAGPPGGPADDPAREVVESHVRSLLPGHLTEVQTSDRHTVKPWLSSRIDVSPPVKDLAELGFPLIGGRLDYVAGHRVACVVYRRDQHIINLLAWATPGAPDQGFSRLARQGFNLGSWRRDGTTFWAISDLEAAELENFAHRIAGDA